MAIVAAIALYWLHALSGEFGNFVDRDLTRLQAYSTMYAQGMNSGQAIRGLMLNPTDADSRNSLAASDLSFRSALAQASGMVEPGTPRADLLAQVDAKWDSLSQQREMFADTVGVLAGENERFLRDEVPLWRDVSGILLRLRNEELKGVQSVKEEIKARAEHVLHSTTILAAGAIGLSVVLTWWVLGRVSRSLGVLSRSLGEMAEGGGNLRAELPVTGGCEIGRTSSAFNAFVGGLRDLVAQARHNTERTSAASQEVV